uniref:Reverse transcriptase domain-containing protein n=1 Tax=Tanacetum cinerariifolium TaxID=118510 RepID=A0A699GNS3_TANCI|nr:hypothetical protein [Tanacetum cinerariifolium]
MSSSTVTYTSIYSDSELWRFQWVSDDEPQSLEAAPQPLEQVPPSLNYVPGLEHPPSLDYVRSLEYPKYVAPSDDEIPVEDQPLPFYASPTALSPSYVADFDTEDDPNEDPADYPTTPPLPRSPWTKVPFSQICLRRAQKTVRLQPPMVASIEALIAEFASAPTPPSPSPSPLAPWFEARESSLATAARSMTDVEEAWSRSKDTSMALDASIRTLEAQKMLPKKTTTTPMTDAAITALIAQGVANALAEYEAHKSSGNGDDSHDSGSGRNIERATRECTYSDFLKCQPFNFKGTEGVVGLAYCALTWWSSYIKTIGYDAAYGMTWKILRKMMTDNYCPRKLALMCGRMFLEEFDKVEKYIDGLLDMLQGSGHYKKDWPKLKNNNHGNQAGNGGATARDYEGKNPNSYVVTGTFLLNQ